LPELTHSLLPAYSIRLSSLRSHRPSPQCCRDLMIAMPSNCGKATLRDHSRSSLQSFEYTREPYNPGYCIQQDGLPREGDYQGALPTNKPSTPSLLGAGRPP
jgi:hypothetical protein